MSRSDPLDEIALLVRSGHGLVLLETDDADVLLAEVRATRPLSVVAAERIAALRRWADGRTVGAN